MWRLKESQLKEITESIQKSCMRCSMSRWESGDWNPLMWSFHRLGKRTEYRIVQCFNSNFSNEICACKTCMWNHLVTRLFPTLSKPLQEHRQQSHCSEREIRDWERRPGLASHVCYWLGDCDVPDFAEPQIPHLCIQRVCLRPFLLKLCMNLPYLPFNFSTLTIPSNITGSLFLYHSQQVFLWTLI